ncbi:MAG: precorrin-6y C5,15-methyltransferase (decarboxylating) subunit CbiE [Bacillota bacterium]|nr:precorrin-6y C5,15-methyltransferase (decarboxylating) subunit CbiE [Bacillota bacterium]
MKVILAGTGCGSLDSMTVEVEAAIRDADMIIGAKRLLEGIPSQWCGEKQAAIYAEEICGIIAAEKQMDKKICVLYSGDSGFYSGTKSLLPLLEESGIHAEVLPGISSIQLFAAKLQIPWQDWLLVSAHGTECDAVRYVMKGQPVFFLTGGRLGPADLCRQLADAGLGGLQAAAGERLSYEDERIIYGDAAEFADMEFAPLSVLLVLPNSPSADLSPGIDDDLFIRGEVPMTKKDVRACILSHMKIQPNDTIWDVGAGTGSVSVEMAMKASAGKVYAVERNAEGISLIDKNREKFGCWNIISVEGSAPEALTDLPAPDRVFIGGSSGSLKPVFDIIISKNPQALICATAIVLETLHETMELMTAEGMDIEIVQVSITRTRPAGSRHMMTAENPIYIITGQKPPAGEQDD